MAYINLIGTVINEIKLSNNAKGEFVDIKIAENKGFGKNAKTFYYEATLWQEKAHTFIKAGVKKGSRIHIDAEHEVVPYINQKNGEKGFNQKLIDMRWQYVPLPFKQSDEQAKAVQPKPEKHKNQPPKKPSNVLNLDDEDLPF